MQQQTSSVVVWIPLLVTVFHDFTLGLLPLWLFNTYREAIMYKVLFYVIEFKWKKLSQKIFRHPPSKMLS